MIKVIELMPFINVFCFVCKKKVANHPFSYSGYTFCLVSWLLYLPHHLLVAFFILGVAFVEVSFSLLFCSISV